MSQIIVNRPRVWDGLGQSIANASTVQEALQMAHMDYQIAKEPCFDKYGKPVQDVYLNVRSTDRAVFGPVGKQYKIVQPRAAFDFMDSIIGSDVQIEQLGQSAGGRKIWMLAKAPEMDLLGDVMQPYFFVSTSFDGSSNTVAGTLLNRLTCANQINMANKTAQRRILIRHSSVLEDKVQEARRLIMASDKYIESLSAKAEKYATYKLSKSEFLMATDEIFGNTDLMKGKELTNTSKLKEQFGVALRQPDLDNFKGSAWHFFNAMGDFATHIDPIRKTVNWKENLFDSFMGDNEYLTKAEKILDALVA